MSRKRRKTQRNGHATFLECHSPVGTEDSFIMGGEPGYRQGSGSFDCGGSLGILFQKLAIVGNSRSCPKSKVPCKPLKIGNIEQSTPDWSTTPAFRFQKRQESLPRQVFRRVK